jgi:hypothetical protein
MDNRKPVPRPDLRCRGSGSGFIQVNDMHFRALCGKLYGNGFADAASGAGNNGPLMLEG